MGLLSSLSDASAQQEQAIPTGPRDHHLFVGANLFLPHEDDFAAVRKLSKSDALLDTPAQDRISIDKTPGFSVRRATKISSVQVLIENLNAKKEYTVGNDPEFAAMSDQAQIENAIAQGVDSAQYGYSISEGASLGATNTRTGIPDDSISSTSDGLFVDVTGPLDAARSIQEAISETTANTIPSQESTSHDMLAVSFEISSKTPIADAYVVVLCGIQIGTDKHNLTFYKRVGEVGQKARNVRIIDDGFPPGFNVTSTQVYIYNHGEEIATNLSEKHYPLTADQARQFIQIDHQSSHREDTLPAQPSWALAPALLLACDTPNEFDYPVTVELDATGQLVSIKPSDRVLPDHCLLYTSPSPRDRG